MDDERRTKGIAGMASEDPANDCYALREECEQLQHASKVVADALRIMSYADEYIGDGVGGVLHMLARVLDQPEFLS